ncbi:hypothetical protein [Streptomyces sp. MZ04]|uniref:hypothetical protein n=1 Tax=Streptomyces sp. MZ04 TaxID=2559236 RepID=UPI00107EA0B1|nr:hypothetical protein [Streptomyces sp. MZ04]TGB06030.1 hypothetical protein E2651_23970 [Streptomyces sp. MZ04]
MPSLDSSRGRFRLADRHIGVLAHLADKETPPTELFHSLRELQGIGLVGEEGELSPLLRDFLMALADPLVLVHVEVIGQSGPLQHGVIVGQETVISHDSWPYEEESEYTPVDPQMLIWEMARKVNLRREEFKAFDPPTLSTTMGALDAAFAALERSGGDPGTARSAVQDALAVSGDLAGPVHASFTDLVLSINSMWRVTTVWDETREGKRLAATGRSLAVWDCGPNGYWIREEPQEPVRDGEIAPGDSLTVTQASGGQLWDRITDLLPDKADLIGD